jgi:hypothetical protein
MQTHTFIYAHTPQTGTTPTAFERTRLVHRRHFESENQQGAAFAFPGVPIYPGDEFLVCGVYVCVFPTTEEVPAHPFNLPPHTLTPLNPQNNHRLAVATIPRSARP